MAWHTWGLAFNWVMGTLRGKGTSRGGRHWRTGVRPSYGVGTNGACFKMTDLLTHLEIYGSGFTNTHAIKCRSRTCTGERLLPGMRGWMTVGGIHCSTYSYPQRGILLKGFGSAPGDRHHSFQLFALGPCSSRSCRQLHAAKRSATGSSRTPVYSITCQTALMGIL